MWRNWRYCATSLSSISWMFCGICWSQLLSRFQCDWLIILSLMTNGASRQIGSKIEQMRLKARVTITVSYRVLATARCRCRLSGNSLDQEFVSIDSRNSVSKSYPVSRLSFRDLPLIIDAALPTQLIFLGLLEVSTPWVGRYQMC